MEQAAGPTPSYACAWGMEETGWVWEMAVSVAVQPSQLSHLAF